MVTRQFEAEDGLGSLGESWHTVFRSEGESGGR
jgi:hypothetical protein